MAFNMPPELKALINTSNGPLVYFAHPMSTYGTALERKLIMKLRAQGMTVLNPGEQWVQDAFQQYREDNPEEDYMKFFACLAAFCSSCAVLSFPAGLDLEGLSWEAASKPLLGAGVVYEMETFFARRVPVYMFRETERGWAMPQITGFDGLTQLTVKQTRQALKLYQPD